MFSKWKNKCKLQKEKKEKGKKKKLQKLNLNESLSFLLPQKVNTDDNLLRQE